MRRVLSPLGLVSVQRPSDGASFDAPVPAGVAAGDAFEVEVPDESAPEAAAMAQVARRLSGEQAAALQRIMAALCGFDELFDFVASNCREFREWRGAEGEQELGWSARHEQYTRLVEGWIEGELAALGSSGADLHALLAGVLEGGADPRADSFLGRLLSLTSYERFCRMMARSRARRTRW